MVAKLIKFLYLKHKVRGVRPRLDHHTSLPCAQDAGELSFRALVEETISQLEGAFALIFKSVHFPNEVAASVLSPPYCPPTHVHVDGSCSTRFPPVARYSHR